MFSDSFLPRYSSETVLALNYTIPNGTSYRIRFLHDRTMGNEVMLFSDDVYRLLDSLPMVSNQITFRKDRDEENPFPMHVNITFPDGNIRKVPVILQQCVFSYFKMMHVTKEIKKSFFEFLTSSVASCTVNPVRRFGVLRVELPNI